MLLHSSLKKSNLHNFRQITNKIIARVVHFVNLYKMRASPFSSNSKHHTYNVNSAPASLGLFQWSFFIMLYCMITCFILKILPLHFMKNVSFTHLSSTIFTMAQALALFIYFKWLFHKRKLKHNFSIYAPKADFLLG